MEKDNDKTMKWVNATIERYGIDTVLEYPWECLFLTQSHLLDTQPESEGKQMKKVQITSKDYPRYGEIGVIVGKEMTVFGYAFKIRFNDGDGLYTADKFKLLDTQPESEEQDATNQHVVYLGGGRQIPGGMENMKKTKKVCQICKHKAKAFIRFEDNRIGKEFTVCAQCYGVLSEKGLPKWITEGGYK